MTDTSTTDDHRMLLATIAQLGAELIGLGVLAGIGAGTAQWVTRRPAPTDQ